MEGLNTVWFAASPMAASLAGEPRAGLFPHEHLRKLKELPMSWWDRRAVARGSGSVFDSHLGFDCEGIEWALVTLWPLVPLVLSLRALGFGLGSGESELRLLPKPRECG